MGRPKLPIDAGIVRKLASRMMTKTEIARIVGCDESVIRKRFAEDYSFGRETGKKRLRDKQLQQALRGNTTMLIWLGKQYLGQADKTESKVEMTEKPPDPIAAYQRDKSLRDRALQLERDIANASAPYTGDAGTHGHSRLAVPPTSPGSRNGRNGDSNGDGQKPAGS